MTVVGITVIGVVGVVVSAAENCAGVVERTGASAAATLTYAAMRGGADGQVPAYKSAQFCFVIDAQGAAFGSASFLCAAEGGGEKPSALRRGLFCVRPLEYISR
jgi:hypothetical protein